MCPQLHHNSVGIASIKPTICSPYAAVSILKMETTKQFHELITRRMLIDEVPLRCKCIFLPRMNLHQNVRHPIKISKLVSLYTQEVRLGNHEVLDFSRLTVLPPLYNQSNKCVYRPDDFTEWGVCFPQHPMMRNHASFFE